MKIDRSLTYFASLLVTKDQLGMSIGHEFFLQQVVFVIELANDGDVRDSSLAPPNRQIDRFPAIGFDGTIGCVNDGVDDISIIKSFCRLAMLVDRIKHVREHIGVPECSDFISDRKQPAAAAFRFFGNIVRHVLSREHFHSGA